MIIFSVTPQTTAAAKQQTSVPRENYHEMGMGNHPIPFHLRHEHVMT
jgi:hypothetical protein